MKRRWLTAGLLTALLLTPELVRAHAYLIKSIPARRAVLMRTPARVQLWFNERLEPQFSHVSVWNQEGTQVDLQDVEVGSDDPRRLSVSVPPLPPGTYTVKYRVLSVDSHVVDDQFLFTLKESR
jgi:methionine-rich copper-binding protein CopC